MRRRWQGGADGKIEDYLIGLPQTMPAFSYDAGYRVIRRRQHHHASWLPMIGRGHKIINPAGRREIVITIFQDSINTTL